MAAALICSRFRPASCSSDISHTAYSSLVRCGSVAMRQMPAQPCPSCTAITTLVSPASMTNSIALSLFPRNDLAGGERPYAPAGFQQQAAVIGEAGKDPDVLLFTHFQRKRRAGW